MSPDRPDDDPFEDPLAGDPLEDPFAGDPLEDPFADDPIGGDGSDGDGDDDLEEAFGDISRSTLVAFIVVGILTHLGVLAGGVGLLFLVFRGQWLVGGALVLTGIVALGLAVVSYRRYRDRDDDDETPSAASGTSE